MQKISKAAFKRFFTEDRKITVHRLKPIITGPLAGQIKPPFPATVTKGNTKAIAYKPDRETDGGECWLDIGPEFGVAEMGDGFIQVTFKGDSSPSVKYEFIKEDEPRRIKCDMCGAVIEQDPPYYRKEKPVCSQACAAADNPALTPEYSADGERKSDLEYFSDRQERNRP